MAVHTPFVSLKCEINVNCTDNTLACVTAACAGCVHLGGHSCTTTSHAGCTLACQVGVPPPPPRPLGRNPSIYSLTGGLTGLQQADPLETVGCGSP
jgi:hypothetical protein